MPESTTTLTYKCILHIRSKQLESQQHPLLQTVLTSIANYLESRFALSLNRDRFISGFPYKIESNGAKMQTVLLQPSADGDARSQWAVSVRVQGLFNRRHVWRNRIGIDEISKDSIILYFAEYFSFYQAGSLKNYEAHDYAPPILLRDFLHSPSFDCMSGSCRLTDIPWLLLDDDISDFLDQLHDPNRMIPIVVVTCPDMVSMTALCARTVGNLVICYLNNLGTFTSLSQHLPVELQFPWNSIKVFLPLTSSKAFHLTISYQEIAKLGSDGTVAALYRAFCTCFTAAERHAFVSLESIAEIIKQRFLLSLRSQNTNLREQCALLSAECESLRLSLQELKTKPTTPLICDSTPPEPSPYEELFENVSHEMVTIKQSITLLTDRLCTNPRDMLSTDGFEKCAEVYDLAIALRTFQSLLITHHA